MSEPSIPFSAASPNPHQAEDDYNRLFALSQDLLCIAGLDGYFKKVNPSWTRVLGWSEAELLARPVADFMHPEDRARTLQARAKLAEGELVRGLENRYVCKDGSYRWLSWQSTIEPAGTTVFAVARDITERLKSDHEQLILSKLESTGILAGGLAHDFNNLLGGMLLNMDMVDLCGTLSDEQRDYLRQVQHAIHAAKSLTQRLMAFAEGGSSARRLLSVSELVRHSMELALSGSAVRGEFVGAADLWPVDVDEMQINQVVHGLVLNAREAMPEGGQVRVHAANVTRAGKGVAATASDFVRISVTDEGAGIAADVLPKIFDPYFSTKQRGAQKGMGLGLTICRTVLQKHGGTIAVESQPGRGTTVTFELPAKRGATVMTAATVADATAARKVLVMDDEPMFRDVVAEALRRLGYHVAAAKHGDEAISLYEQAENGGSRFDVVLLDLTVRGGKGGSETMKVLRARDPEVKAVLMTGYSNEPTFRDYAVHGFRGALSKPFSIDALQALLGRILQPSAVNDMAGA